MSFSEKLKKEVRKRAAFRCCRCQKVGIQVHHIIPEEHDGEDTIENAAPLCAGCHDDFGGNPEKWKGITGMRDWWYERAESHFGPNPSSEKLEQINAKLQNIEANMPELKDLLRSVADEMINNITPGTAPATASSIVNSSSVVSSLKLGPEVHANSVFHHLGTRRCSRQKDLIRGTYFNRTANKHLKLLDTLSTQAYQLESCPLGTQGDVLRTSEFESSPLGRTSSKVVHYGLPISA